MDLQSLIQMAQQAGIGGGGGMPQGGAPQAPQAPQSSGADMANQLVNLVQRVMSTPKGMMLAQTIGSMLSGGGGGGQQMPVYGRGQYTNDPREDQAVDYGGPTTYSGDLLEQRNRAEAERAGARPTPRRIPGGEEPGQQTMGRMINRQGQPMPGYLPQGPLSDEQQLELARIGMGGGSAQDLDPRMLEAMENLGYDPNNMDDIESYMQDISSNQRKDWRTGKRNTDQTNQKQGVYGKRARGEGKHDNELDEDD